MALHRFAGTRPTCLPGRAIQDLTCVMPCNCNGLREINLFVFVRKLLYSSLESPLLECTNSGRILTHIFNDSLTLLSV